MRILDVYSCAGGAGMGYRRAGFVGAEVLWAMEVAA